MYSSDQKSSSTIKKKKIVRESYLVLHKIVKSVKSNDVQWSAYDQGVEVYFKWNKKKLNWTRRVKYRTPKDK